jgi:hypothetical protein
LRYIPDGSKSSWARSRFAPSILSRGAAVPLARRLLRQAQERPSPSLAQRDDRFAIPALRLGARLNPLGKKKLAM